MKNMFLAMALLCSCQAFSQGWGGWQTTNTLGDYSSKKDLNYVGDGKTYHNLDVYYPQESKDSYPVIIHIYGSAWLSNNYKSSADLGTVGLAALKAGYVFVTPNHRASSDASFPAQLNDIKAVVRYLRGNAESLKLDTSFIAISGFSSGGHLASLMGTTRNIKVATQGSVMFDLEGSLGNYTDYSSSVDAVCDWSGPVCLTEEEGCGLILISSNPSYEAQEMGCSQQGNEDKYDLATAITYIDPTDPPFMLVHGSADNIVPQCQSERFARLLKEGGVESEYIPTSTSHGVDANQTGKMIEFFDKAKAAKPMNNETSSIYTRSDQQIYLYENQLYIPDLYQGLPYKIGDLTGQLLQSGVTDKTIELKGFQKGIYFIMIEGQPKSITYKLIVK